MRNTFIRSLTKWAETDSRIFLLTADIGYSVIETFAERFPKQFMNVGIAEQNAVGVAAGLAMSGKIPFFYTIIPFATMRCFEQIRVDLAYQNTNVCIVGVGAGFGYGPAGATHHSIEDLALMRALPNMTVLAPGDPIEVDELTRQTLNIDGPIYMRLGKGGDPSVHESNPSLTIGKFIKLKSGDDVALISTSTMLNTAMTVAKQLGTKNIGASVFSAHTLKPFDKETIASLHQKKIPIFTIEEHSIVGGLGSATAETLADLGGPIFLKRIGVPDKYTHDIGSQDYLRRIYKLDPTSIEETILISLTNFKTN